MSSTNINSLGGAVEFMGSPNSGDEGGWMTSPSVGLVEPGTGDAAVDSGGKFRG